MNQILEAISRHDEVVGVLEQAQASIAANLQTVASLRMALARLREPGRPFLAEMCLAAAADNLADAERDLATKLAQLR